MVVIEELPDTAADVIDHKTATATQGKEPSKQADEELRSTKKPVEQININDKDAPALMSIVIGNNKLRNMFLLWSAALWVSAAFCGLVAYVIFVARGLDTVQAACIGAIAAVLGALAVVALFATARFCTPMETAEVKNTEE